MNACCEFCCSRAQQAKGLKTASTLAKIFMTELSTMKFAATEFVIKNSSLECSPSAQLSQLLDEMRRQLDWFHQLTTDWTPQLTSADHCVHARTPRHTCTQIIPPLQPRRRRRHFRYAD